MLSGRAILSFLHHCSKLLHLDVISISICEFSIYCLIPFQLYEELLNAREEARMAHEQLTSNESVRKEIIYVSSLSIDFVMIIF